MTFSPRSFVLPAAVAIVGVAAIVLWARIEPRVEIAARLPGMDGAPRREPLPDAPPPIPGQPTRGAGLPSSLVGAWPWFRGPGRDAISPESLPLARRWGSSGPKRLWQIELGEGYAAAVVAGGCVYVLDHVADGVAERLRGLSAADRQRLAQAVASVEVHDASDLERFLDDLVPGDGADAEASAGEARAQRRARLREWFDHWLATDRAALVAALQRGWIDQVDLSADVLRCLSLDDGRELWHNGYRVVVPLHHGRSRTVPAVFDGVVVTLGPKCHVAAWDGATGEALWLMDLVLEHGATVPPWYAGQCPLIDESTGQVILAPGGDALLMAVELRTGHVVWKSPNPRGWAMTHSSIIPMELAGRRMYVYCGKGGVAGVDARDGSLLWDTTDWQIGMATCPSPVPIGDGRVFFCGGYNAGALMLRVVEQSGRFRAETLYRLDARRFGSEQQTPVLHGQHLYGVRQRDGRLVCLDLDGTEQWNSGADRFGAAPYMIADGLIFALNDEGRLTLAEATPEAYRVLDRAVVLPDGVDSWGPMALVGGRLIVRDMTRMVCLDVAASP